MQAINRPIYLRKQSRVYFLTWLPISFSKRRLKVDRYDRGMLKLNNYNMIKMILLYYYNEN